MVKKIIQSFLFGLIFSQCIAQNQGITNNWLMGYYGGYGVTKIDFFSGAPVVDSFPIPMEFNHTHSNISDSMGNLLFYTNGYYIADASNDTMQNGSGINPSTYTSYFSDGLGIPQANIILPSPGIPNFYYLIHSTVDKYPGYTCSYDLYYSVIDMNLNGGLGAVTGVKNQILLSDSMNPGKISACRHANGRDWWIMCHRLNSDIFYSFLLSPNGIDGPYFQNMGIIRGYDGGQAVFSHDGSRYAYYHVFDGLEVFDFDRCAGLLSNPQLVNVPLNGGFNVGMAISGNSKVLYVPNVYDVLQYDLTSSNISSTAQIVAVYDSFTSYIGSAPPLQTLFGLAALAPDGKIYISTGNSTVHLHVINQPDSVGLSCDLVQHGLQLPTYAFNTFPNHPNYFLGKIPGSPCDTIPLNTSIDEFPERILKVSPNPTSDEFTIWFSVQDKPGIVEIFDVNGTMVRKDYIVEWSQYKKLNISNLPNGLYFSRMSWNKKIVQVKIIKH